MLLACHSITHWTSLHLSESLTITKSNYQRSAQCSLLYIYHDKRQLVAAKLEFYGQANYPHNMKFLEDKPSCRFANSVGGMSGTGECMMSSDVLQYADSPFVAAPALHRAPGESSPPYLEPVLLGSSGNIFTLVEGLPSWRLCGRDTLVW
ncbi:hypothetical protein RRG08_055372 [Elysia crispata]|uniref:Uncharacterized protein n=1 Tax=Elysia crispata TaxID=231223 RepID=A0AAE1AQQ0_9GAST|nr:hypothetical protein RRG08_055372 [Elysia crispata]